MKLISSNQKLEKTFHRLIESYSEILFAVAWASSGNSVFELLQTRPSRITRAIIGTHFYQTHPDVLDTFQGKSNVTFGLFFSLMGSFIPSSFYSATKTDGKR